MFQVNENVRKGIFENLQNSLLPAKLNQTSNRNVGVLLGWLGDEGLLQDATASPETIAAMLLAKILLEPNALFWDIAPNFEEPAPKQLSKKEANEELNRRHAEAQARDIKRRQQEQAENSESAFWEKQKQFEANKKAENEKLAEEVAASDLYTTIMNFSVNRGPHAVDHARSEEIRRYLLGVAVNIGGKKHNRETLRFVNEVISRLDNDATVAKVRVVVEDINRERQRAAERKPRRDSLGVF